MFIIKISIVIFIIICFGYLIIAAHRKSIFIWIGSYIVHSIRLRFVPKNDLTHIIFCWVDHFEPMWNGALPEQQKKRMRTWMDNYPKLADIHLDSNGRPLQHTWFYPGEEYSEEHIELLIKLCRLGYGEIEFHHHHHNETSEGLLRAFNEAIGKFQWQGIFSNTNEMKGRYAFIHGNMGLSNSRGEKWCGVNDELAILRETGCFADFSYPTAPCISQTKKINSIYYATSDKLKPKSHNEGESVRVGGSQTGDLMMIQGPLTFNWWKRWLGILPTIDNAEIQETNPGVPNRVDNWIRQHIHVRGKPNWVFVKVSCHGAPEMNYECCLGQSADQMLSYLEKVYNDGIRFVLHYVTAREMYNIIKAAEAGQDGNPSYFLDNCIPAPLYKNGN